MLTRIEVRAPSGALLSLPLALDFSGYSVEDIDGLGPCAAQLVYTKLAGMHGAQYQSSTRETRNIILTLGFQPDYASGDTVASMRTELYNFFMTGAEVKLKFVTTETTLDITGVVETCVPDMFSKEPQMVISIMCFDSDFYKATPIVMSGNTVATTVETSHIYAGTVETGFLFKLMANRAISEFTIYHRKPNNTVGTLEFVTDLVSGDVAEIQTVPGSKFARIIRAGAPISALSGVSPYSSWLSLVKGDNKIRVYAAGAPVPFTIEYTEKHGAI